MFDKIKDLAPIIVHTGTEFLEDFIDCCYENGIYWCGSQQIEVAKLKAKKYAEHYRENVSMSFHNTERRTVFLFDDIKGTQIYHINRDRNIPVYEYQEFNFKKEAADFSDFNIFL